MENLLADIEAFCTTWEVSASRFGELAMNDKAFVHQLRSNRRVWPETEAKVRQFMATYRPDAQPATPTDTAQAA